MESWVTAQARLEGSGASRFNVIVVVAGWKSSSPALGAVGGVVVVGGPAPFPAQVTTGAQM